MREQVEREIIERLVREQRWDELVAEMDRQDENRQQRAEYHEVSRSEVADEINTGRRKYGKPRASREYNLSNIASTPWEDIIFDSPEEIGEMLSDRVNIQGIRKLTAKQKEVLFYRYAQGISIQDLARTWGCSDRNIVKHIHAGAEKFQKYVTPILKARVEQCYTITTNQRWFLKWLENPLQNKEALDRMRADGTLEEWLENYIPIMGKEEHDGD
jgi:DNA-directed RNA polymerase specialized sigma24 family protein